MRRAVLDANVYVSAAMRPEGAPGQIFSRFLDGGAFELVSSPAIIAEVLRALAYPKVRRRIRGPLAPEAWFESIALLADTVHGTADATGRCRDPDDEIYLVAAVEGRADVIVSGDGDLLALGEHEGIRIVSPREFLTMLD